MWTLLLLAGAVVTDVREGRVYNRIICLGLGTGFLFQLWELGYKGVPVFIFQISVPVVVFFLLFRMRALGAGDIKLFSVIGSLFSLKVLCWCIIWSFIAGAALSLFKLLYHKNLMSRLTFFCRYLQEVFLFKTLPCYNRYSDGKDNIIHFSIAILIGFFITIGVVY